MHTDGPNGRAAPAATSVAASLVGAAHAARCICVHLCASVVETPCFLALAWGPCAQSGPPPPSPDAAPKPPRRRRRRLWRPPSRRSDMLFLLRMGTPLIES